MKKQTKYQSSNGASEGVRLNNICAYRPDMFYKKVVLRYFTIFTGKHLCQSLFLIKLQILNFIEKVANFIEKETLAQAFSCEFCEISKNTFVYRTLLPAASDDINCYTYSFL